ncbi:hypothetical protein A628_00731 [Salmonella enterica subsp. enterica serovar Cubana str. 76814]|uniref:Uncharacterized protein n=1 Tax=Salmonella enterica subsp. enterica serovar Cubana str. 76814 TaxID=1192560 RepID=V7ITT7_SALET|nr:hypothetical protein A628_00731 [Salmonella enterica subsp. enterica serovar Cubana str. 76814]
MFPAPAGINRRWQQPHTHPPCVPRASGDKPLYELPLLPGSSCSPRQRG